MISRSMYGVARIFRYFIAKASTDRFPSYHGGNRNLILTESARAELIELTRSQWSWDTRVQIETVPNIRVSPDGVWLQAWLLAGRTAPISPEARERAMLMLPVMLREIYRLHREDGLSFDAIGAQLGFAGSEVRRLFADALLIMDRWIAHGRGEGDVPREHPG